MGAQLKVVQGEILDDSLANLEFLELDARIKKGLHSWIDTGKSLEEMRQKWPGWSAQERNGYTDFYREYIPKVCGMSSGNAKRLMQACFIFEFLSSHGSPSILPTNERQLRMLGQVLSDGGWLKIEDKNTNEPIVDGGKVRPRALSKAGEAALKDAWEGVVARAEEHARKRQEAENKKAQEEGRKPKAILPEHVLTAKFIEETPKVYRYVGKRKAQPLDSSKFGTLTRRMGKTEEYINGLWERYGGDFSQLAVDDKWNKGRKKALRECIATLAQALEEFDDAIKNLRVPE